MVTNFNKIYNLLFNYLENNPVGIAYRKCVIFFKISLQAMGLKSLIKSIFLENCETFPQMLFLFPSKPLQIFVPVLFEDTVKGNCFWLHAGYTEAIRSSTESIFVLPAARFFSASSRRTRNACRLTVRKTVHPTKAYFVS